MTFRNQKLKKKKRIKKKKKLSTEEISDYISQEDRVYRQEKSENRGAGNISKVIL